MLILSLNQGLIYPPQPSKKCIFETNKTSKMLVSRGQGLKYDHGVFGKIHHECMSSWQNPYFCI